MYSELTGQRNELLEGLSEVEEENEILLKQMEESKLVAMDTSKEIQEVQRECIEVSLLILN